MQILLSCISTRHSVLKNHWKESAPAPVAESETETELSCPLTTLGSFKKPEGDLGGQVCVLNDQGQPEQTVALPLAAGMVTSSEGVLVTTFKSIHEIHPQIGAIRYDVVSLPVFNALHSISRTQCGYVVASTGLDLLVEFNLQGEILWEWWATEHGFEYTPTGERRVIDKTIDQREVKYGTLQQTTHVNSVAELPDGRFLATLFHQGTVIVIDRETGNWQTVLEGLDHPHAARVLDSKHFTVADTVHGKALLVRLEGNQGQIIEAIDAGTNWLQDCSYHPAEDRWVLVDGKRSQVQIRGGRSGDRPIGWYAFDPEWRLYEAYAINKDPLLA
jgi:hypothetical protein